MLQQRHRRTYTFINTKLCTQTLCVTYTTIHEHHCYGPESDQQHAARIETTPHSLRHNQQVCSAAGQLIYDTCSSSTSTTIMRDYPPACNAIFHTLSRNNSLTAWLVFWIATSFKYRPTCIIDAKETV